MNIMKTFLLMFLMIVLFAAAGRYIGGEQGMIMALLLAIVMNVFSYWFSDKIVLAMYRAKPVQEQDQPELFRIVRNMAVKENIPMPKVYVIDTATPNAFATGRNPQHAAVAVTGGIMDILNEQELTAVIAHEMSHVLNRDILISTIAATFAGAITVLARIGEFAMIFGGMGGRDRDDRGGGLGMLFMIILAPIAAILIQLAISRSREYLADAGSAKITHNPLALASALKKLEEAAKQVPMQATPATAHMFIVNPLRGEGLANLFSTHPPMSKRIALLEKMDQEQKMAGMPKIIS